MIWQKVSIEKCVRSGDFKGQKNGICIIQRKYLSQKNVKYCEIFH